MKFYSAIVAISLLPALAFSQTTAEEWYDKGARLKTDKKSGEALIAFKEAVKLKSDYKEAWYEMGWCQNDTKDYAENYADKRKYIAVFVSSKGSIPPKNGM